MFAQLDRLGGGQCGGADDDGAAAGRGLEVALGGAFALVDAQRGRDSPVLPIGTKPWTPLPRM